MAHSPNTANKHKKLLRDIFSVLGHFEMSDNEEYVSNFSGYPGCGVAYVSGLKYIGKLVVYIDLCFRCVCYWRHIQMEEC